METKSAQGRKTIPLAYVTKWATTTGILVVRNGESVPREGRDDAYLRHRHMFVTPNHWTEDRGVAIQRWRNALSTKIVSHKKAVAKLEEALMGDPDFKEETK